MPSLFVDCVVGRTDASAEKCPFLLWHSLSTLGAICFVVSLLDKHGKWWPLLCSVVLELFNLPLPLHIYPCPLWPRQLLPMMGSHRQGLFVSGGSRGCSPLEVFELGWIASLSLSGPSGPVAVDRVANRSRYIVDAGRRGNKTR